MKILTAAEMREIDRLTTERYSISSLVLMENAGFNLYLTLREYFPQLEQEKIAIFCGKGNNGGDGLVVARQLVQRGVEPLVFLLSDPQQLAGDARVNLDIYLGLGGPIHPIRDLPEWQSVRERLDGCTVLVDAILGTGIKQPLSGLYAQVVEDINHSSAFVVSVDIPSGMASDLVASPGESVWADATVTFTAPKIAHVLGRSQSALGEVRIVSIGTPEEALQDPALFLELIRPESIAWFLLPRRAESHKGTYGHVAIVAGSLGKSGAGILCATASLRAGSGLVTWCVPQPVQPIAAGFQPEVMTQGFTATETGALGLSALPALLDFLGGKDAAALGPGLTTEPDTVELVVQLVQQSPVPLVLDADALNAFSGRLNDLRNEKAQPLILTPHPAEFARLSGKSVSEIQERPVELAREFARDQGVWLVLKSFRTLVASPSGTVHACAQGNPGMATAGMGDVLTGVIASLVGQTAAQGQHDPLQLTQAVCAAVLIHALAGDLCAQTEDASSIIAGDVIRSLGASRKHLQDMCLDPPSQHAGIRLQQ